MPLGHYHSPTTATLVAVGESVEDELSAGDIDYFRVTVSSPGDFGHIELPTKPGLGFDLIGSEVENTIEYSEELGGELYYENDGSVADW